MRAEGSESSTRSFLLNSNAFHSRMLNNANWLTGHDGDELVGDALNSSCGIDGS